jgi:hypothetical protein
MAKIQSGRGRGNKYSIIKIGNLTLGITEIFPGESFTPPFHVYLELTG